MMKKIKYGGNYNGYRTLDQLPSYVDDVINGYYHDDKFYEDSLLTHTYDVEGKYTISLKTSFTTLGSLAVIPYYNLIKSVRLSNNITSIGNSAFRSFGCLINVTIPSTVTSIGTYAFNGCYSLTNVTIPNSVTSIGINAFQNCYSLTNVIIPNGVTSINYTFGGCFSLTNITIPNSVTSIGNNTFASCSNCSIFDFSNHTSVPALISSTAFSDTTGKIVVPDALYNDWIGATNWSSLTSKIIKVSEWEAL